MLHRTLRVPLLLAVWQVAPYSVAEDSTGRVQISLGYGSGQYEYQTFSCSGERLTSTPVDFQTAGVEVEAWPTDRLRLSGFGGRISTLEHNGPYYGLQIAREWRAVGLGVGVAHVPGSGDFEEGMTVPTLYMRFGDLHAAHLQLDAFSPSPTFGTTGWLRTGIGFRAGRGRRVRGLFGVAFGPYSYPDDPTPRLFGELDLPVYRGLDLSLRGSYRQGVEIPQWAGGVALRYHIGR